MGKAILITSGKGGVGKTTIVASLGLALSSFGKSVVLVDADVGLNNLDLVLGLENKVVYDVLDILEGRARIKQALVESPFAVGMYLLPSSRNIGGDIISTKRFREIVERLKTAFDYVLIDCPAGIDIGFDRCVNASDEAIVVVTQIISSIRDGDKVLRLLSKYGMKNSSVVVNTVRGDLIISGEVLSPESIADLMQAELIGVIPVDDTVIAGSNVGALPTSEAPFGESIYMLADNILNGKRNLYDCTRTYKGLLGSIKRSLKRRV